MAFPRPTPRVCPRCKKPIRKSRARFCQEPDCKRIRSQVVMRAQRAAKALAAATHCRLCPAPRLPSREVCATHAWLKARCDCCGERIERRDGPGRQAEVCTACDAKRWPSKRLPARQQEPRP